MKYWILAAMLGASLISSTAAFADADDAKWIAQCQADNKGEGASADVITKYCTCMNDKMSSNETRSISQWEKTHPNEMHACEKASGWK